MSTVTQVVDDQLALRAEHLLLRQAACQALDALKRVGCRTAKILSNGNTCEEVLARGEVWNKCSVCAAASALHEALNGGGK